MASAGYRHDRHEPVCNDYGFRTENSEAMILIAATRLMLAKLT